MKDACGFVTIEQDCNLLNRQVLGFWEPDVDEDTKACQDANVHSVTSDDVSY